MRRHLAWFLLALAACSSQDRTRLAVTVYSDLSIPMQIDTLRIEVQGPTGAPQQVEYALATQPTEGKVILPVQTILVPQGKKDDARRTFQEVMTRFPQGTGAQEARAAMTALGQ